MTCAEVDFRGSITMSTESFNSWSLILNSLKTVANDFDNALNQKIE